MVFLSRGNTCITHVYDPTPGPLHSNGSERSQYTHAYLNISKSGGV